MVGQQAVGSRPEQGHGRSLRSAAAVRLAGILLLVFLVISLGATLFLRHLNTSAATEKLDNAVQHFRARIVGIEQGWQKQADVLRSQIIFTRLLEIDEPRMLRARFTSFAASSGGSSTFTHLVLIGPDGTLFATYRTRSQQDLPLPSPADAVPAWIFGDRDRTLYRAIGLPVLINGARGRLLLYTPLDNAMLSDNAFPDSRISLSWQGQPVAESAPLPPLTNRRVEVGRAISWIDGTTSPELDIRTRLNVPLTPGDLLLIVLATVGLIAMLGWIVLGRWLAMQSRRINTLESAVMAFSAAQTLVPNLARELERSGAGTSDEISRLSRGMGRMMEEIENAHAKLLRSQRSLIESERKYRSLVEQASDAIFLCTADGRISDINEVGLQMLGYAKDEVLQHEFEDFLEPDGRRWMPSLPARLREGKAILAERRMRHRDGGTVVAEFNIRMLPDGEILGIARDVTERRELANQLVELNASLERRVTERTAELAHANSELEAFVYAVSHDLRTPLRGIDGFSKLLLQNHAAALGAEGTQYLDRVRKGIQRMGNLIDDLLELSRVTRGVMKPESVDVSVLAHEIAAELQRNGEGRAVEWIIQPGITVAGDAGLLRLVLENLLGNAFKYSRMVSSARIELGAAKLEDGVELFVRDNGAGFDMTYIDKLFQPFQRLHSTREFEGTGVGLATVERIVKRHHGRLRAYAEINRGAAFFVYFPKGSVTP